MGPSLSCAFGVKRHLTEEGRIKLKHLNLCIGQNIKNDFTVSVDLMVLLIMNKQFNEFCFISDSYQCSPSHYRNDNDGQDSMGRPKETQQVSSSNPNGTLRRLENYFDPCPVANCTLVL